MKITLHGHLYVTQSECLELSEFKVQTDVELGPESPMTFDLTVLQSSPIFIMYNLVSRRKKISSWKECSIISPLMEGNEPGHVCLLGCIPHYSSSYEEKKNARCSSFGKWGLCYSKLIWEKNAQRGTLLLGASGIKQSWQRNMSKVRCKYNIQVAFFCLSVQSLFLFPYHSERRLFLCHH